MVTSSLRFLSLLCASLIAAPHPAAADSESKGVSELIPENNAPSEFGFDTKYLNTLTEYLIGNDRYRTCQMVREVGSGASDTETSVYLTRRKDDKAVVVSRRARKNINALLGSILFDEHRGYLPSKPPIGNADFEVAEAEISPSSADVLEQVCEAVVARTRYPSSPSLSTRPEIHVANYDPEYGYRAGKTRAPSGIVAALVDLLDQLHAFPWHDKRGRVEAEKQIGRGAESLAKELRGIGQPLPDVRQRRTRRTVRLPEP